MTCSSLDARAGTTGALRPAGADRVSQSAVAVRSQGRRGIRKDVRAVADTHSAIDTACSGMLVCYMVILEGYLPLAAVHQQVVQDPGTESSRPLQ